ncbi:uncharacterized protein TNCV_3540811 [Trichonephila clavipes]|nr:uncharacterized protein TNCV_3540811 [Trichonephila clavipes]
MISIYERKILRLIFGGIQENGTWRRRSNLELYQSCKESEIVNFIKIQRIKWASRGISIDENHTKMYNVTRRRSRPNLRWIDGPEKYLPVVRTKNWRTLAGRRLAWKRLLLRRSRPTLGCRVTAEGRRAGYFGILYLQF